MNLEQLRVFVRTQLDLDDTDLPNDLLNLYIQEGFDRVVGLEQRWPSYQTLWVIDVTAGVQPLLPPDARVIEQLYNADGRSMPYVDIRWAMGAFGPAAQGTTGTPAYWSSIGPDLMLYPNYNADSQVTAVGYRQPSDWIAQGAGAEVDADRRLHIPIAWYACSLGYAQQEDEVLEQTYLNRFKESSALARDAIMRAWTGSPKRVFYTHYPPNGVWARQPQLVFQLPGP